MEAVESSERLKHTQDYDNHNNENNNHYGGNKATKIEGKDKEVRRVENPYANFIMGNYL